MECDFADEETLLGKDGVSFWSPVGDGLETGGCWVAWRRRDEMRVGRNILMTGNNDDGVTVKSSTNDRDQGPL